MKLVFVAIVVLFCVGPVAAVLVGCHPPTPAQVGAGVRDCSACVAEVAPLFARCGAHDAGAE
jgi:hypothetical protein